MAGEEPQRERKRETVNALSGRAICGIGAKERRKEE
jgi:hypothetical protein